MALWPGPVVILTPSIKNKSSFTLTHSHSHNLQSTILFPLLDQEIKKKGQKIKQPIIFDSDLCEPQMALEVISFC